jgi:hypothetical protein
MIGLPLCPNAPKPIQTSTDTSPEREAQAIAEDAAKIQGSTDFKVALEKAKAAQEKINLLSEIPANAPQWVKIFASTYGDSVTGDITFQENNYYVTLVVGDNIDALKEETLKFNDPVTQINPITQNYSNTAQYAYSPVLSEALVQTLEAGTQTFLLYTLWKLKEAPTEIIADTSIRDMTTAEYLAKQKERLKQKIEKVDKNIESTKKEIQLLESTVNAELTVKNKDDKKLNTLNALYKKLEDLLTEKKTLISYGQVVIII